MMRKLCALVGVISLLALVAACGVSVGPQHALSAPSLAAGISSQLKSYYGLKDPPVVSCPDGILASKGTTFVCTTVLEGQKIHLDGKVTGSNGKYDVAPRDPIMKMTDLERILSKSIKTNPKNVTNLSPKVTCGSNKVAVVGTITCLATFPKLPGSRKVITTIGTNGSVTYQLQS